MRGWGGGEGVGECARSCVAISVLARWASFILLVSCSSRCCGCSSFILCLI